MTDEEFWKELRKMIREEVAAYMGAVSSLQEPEEWISTAALCKELAISKQTLYNWLKHPKTKKLIEANRQKTGSKVKYNITAIKAAIKKHPALFGSGRDYPFGLTMAGISSKAAGSLENKKKYNGIEFIIMTLT